MEENRSADKSGPETEARRDGGSVSAGNRGGRRIGAARAIALVGLMAAAIECVKLALAAIPNVEAVTLLIGLFSYVFGPLGVLATVIFVIVEVLIWGFGTWAISYFIYWPLVGAVFLLLGRRRVRNRLVLTFAAVLLTLFFGVLSSLVDVGLFSGSYDNFLYRFGIYYARGIYFYLAQTVSNAVLFPLLFRPMERLLSRIRMGR